MSELSRADIAARLGVSEQRVSQLSSDPSFPEPTRTRHGKRWRLADVEVWERRHRSRTVELFDVLDIGQWFSEGWPMGNEPHKRILYLLQAHRIIQVAEHNGRALYDVSTVRRLWAMLTEIRPTPERIASEVEAVEIYRECGVPQHAAGESAYWLKALEPDGPDDRSGVLMSESMEPPALPARPTPEEDNED